MPVETELQIDDLLNRMTTACVTSAQALDKAMQSDEWTMPQEYHIPQMKLTLKVAMTISDKKVKGLFKKTTTGSESQSTSTIELDIVARPRTSP